MTRVWAIAAVCVAVLGLGATLIFVLRAPADRFAECRRMQIAGNVQLGGPFTLIDETGATVTDADVITEPTLIYFGYTFCPDVCPLDTVRNAEAVDILAEEGFSTTPVMITVDPKRDTPEELDAFTANIHPKFLGLTGSDAQIAAVAKAYRALYNIADPDDEFYLVNHSAFTYLVAPEVGFLTVFDRALSGEQLADQMRCFVEKL